MLPERALQYDVENEYDSHDRNRFHDEIPVSQAAEGSHCALVSGISCYGRHRVLPLGARAFRGSKKQRPFRGCYYSLDGEA